MTLIAQSGQTYDLTGQHLRQGSDQAIIIIADAQYVTIQGGILDGENSGWTNGAVDMFRHSILIWNSAHIRIKTSFRNPVSDAICIGLIEGSIQDFPCDDIIIENCDCYGNSQNRQFVSVVNAYNVIIRHNHSVDMARADQPGHIDIEPFRPDQVAWNIRVEDNLCEGGAARGIQAYNEIANSPQFGEISILRNTIRGARDVGIACQGSPVVNEGRVTVEGNSVSGATHPYYFSNMEVTQGKRKHKKKRRKH